MVEEVTMKTIKIDTETINKAAAECGTTPEGYISEIRSLSLGRKVCAHFKRIEGAMSIFVCA